MLQSSDQPTTQTTALTSKPTSLPADQPLWMLVIDTTMATGTQHTTHRRPYRFLTYGISVDIPSADTNLHYKIPLSQRLSVLDRVVTHPFYRHTSVMPLHHSEVITAHHIIYTGDTIPKMPEDRYLEGWPTLLLLLFLDTYTVIGDTTHKMSEDLYLEGWPPLQFLLFPDNCVCRPHGDTTHKMPQDRCLEGWPSLQFLLFLDRCDYHIALKLLAAELTIHSSSAYELSLHLWGLSFTTASCCISLYPVLLRFITPTLDFDKHVWFS